MTNYISEERRRGIIEYIDEGFKKHNFEIIIDELKNLMKDDNNEEDGLSDECVMKEFINCLVGYRNSMNIPYLCYSFRFIHVDTIIEYYDLFLREYIEDYERRNRENNILPVHNGEINGGNPEINFIVYIFSLTCVKEEHHINYLWRKFNGVLERREQPRQEKDEFLSFVYCMSHAANYNYVKNTNITIDIEKKYNLFEKMVSNFKNDELNVNHFSLRSDFIKMIKFHNISGLIEFYNKNALLIYGTGINYIGNVVENFNHSFKKLNCMYDDGFTKTKNMHIMNRFWIKVTNSLIREFFGKSEQYQLAEYLEKQSVEIIKKYDTNYTHKEHYFDCIKDDNIKNIIHYGFMPSLRLEDYEAGNRDRLLSFYSRIISNLFERISFGERFNTNKRRNITTYTIEYFYLLTKIILEEVYYNYKNVRDMMSQICSIFNISNFRLLKIWNNPSAIFEELYNKYFKNCVYGNEKLININNNCAYVLQNANLTPETFKEIIKDKDIGNIIEVVEEDYYTYCLPSLNADVFYEILMNEKLYEKFINKDLRFDTNESNIMKVDDEYININYCDRKHFKYLKKLIASVFERLTDRSKCLKLAKKYIFMSITNIGLIEPTGYEIYDNVYNFKEVYNVNTRNIKNQCINYGFVFRNNCLKHDDYVEIYEYSKRVEKAFNEKICHFTGENKEYIKFDMFYIIGGTTSTFLDINVVREHIINMNLKYFYNLMIERHSILYGEYIGDKGLSILEGIMYTYNECGCDIDKKNLSKMFSGLLSGRIIFDRFDYNERDIRVLMKNKDVLISNDDYNETYNGLFIIKNNLMHFLHHRLIDINKNKKDHTMRKEYKIHMYRTHLKAFLCQNWFVKYVYYSPHTEIGKRKIKNDYEKLMRELGVMRESGAIC